MELYKEPTIDSSEINETEKINNYNRQLHRRKIVIIEDSDEIATLCIRAFEKMEVKNEIIRCKNGKEAFEYLLQRGERSPEFILLDLKLPDMSGFEILEKVKTHPTLFSVPVIVFTSSMERKDVRTAYYLGANSYVQKPFDHGEFLNTIEQISKYWLGINKTES